MDIITVEKRDPAVKAKALRRMGQAPCSIFGASLPESILIQLDQKSARQMLREKREGAKVELALDGKSLPVLIKEVDRNFETGAVVHIGFQVLEADKKANSKARIVLKNKDKLAGSMEQLIFEVPYAAVPAAMIDTVDIDLAGLPAGTAITLGEIPAFQKEGMELLLPAEDVILKIKERKGFLKAAEG